MKEKLFLTLRELERDGTVSQRDLSARMGLSLGMVNHLVNALLEKGYVKARRFKNSRNKMAYMYVLTPSGISERVAQTQAFLVRKMDEYERLKEEIESLKKEITK